MTADPIPDQAPALTREPRGSDDALTRTAQEHLADLLFTLADLRTQAVRTKNGAP